MGVIFNMLNRNNAEAFKQSYPRGTRILLEKMDDPYAPVPPGTRGTVILADDAGQIQMQWDNGRTLALIPRKDWFRKLTQQELAAEQRAAAPNSHSSQDEDSGFEPAPEDLEGPSLQKPQAAIIGADGNIFNLLGIAKEALLNDGQEKRAADMQNRIFKSKSYEQALGILMEYVEPVRADEIKRVEDEDYEPQM